MNDSSQRGQGTTRLAHPDPLSLVGQVGGQKGVQKQSRLPWWNHNSISVQNPLGWGCEILGNQKNILLTRKGLALAYKTDSKCVNYKGAVNSGDCNYNF